MKVFDYEACGLKPPPVRTAPPVGPPHLANLVSLAAGRAPDDEALADPSRRFTFRELDSAVNRAAHFLLSEGVAPGDRVACAMPNRWEAVVGFFAVMRIGAVWVGIYRILPVSDKRHILGHSGARLLLADADTAAEIGAIRADLPDLENIVAVDCDSSWVAAIAAGADTLPELAIDLFAPAAIMYISGTTGLPKGCVYSQHNIVTVAAAASAHGLMSPDARRVTVLPITITNVMILGPVIAYWNAKAFILGVTTKIGPMVEWLVHERIGQCAFVPTMIYDLLQHDLDLPLGLVVGAGGAPISQTLQSNFHARFGQHVQPSYGLTEAPTVVASPRDMMTPEGASGFALPHLDLAIRDAEGRELPPGEVGEICFAAVRSGRWAHVYAPPLGYWHEPAKTAALLVCDVVHTGDVGSVDADGWLTVADRSSELILRGGSNVCSAEIKKMLNACDALADCAVIGRPDDRLGMRTLAGIQLADQHGDRELVQPDLKARCTQQLARYKVPDEWHFAKAFPRNAIGKIVKPWLRELMSSPPAIA
ncbi:AMP-binding protein [Novosphingobium sp. ERN07]|nr:AMP-binding protein [Novosphingobium sp. ERN07]NLR73412.1 AMP-binding protein [Novosphingobium sp. ERN07]